MSFASDLDLNVREAISSDASRIAALAAQLGYDVPESRVARVLSERVESQSQEVFVAVVPRVGVVGWLEAVVEAFPTICATAACEMIVAGLIVDDEYRGVNIGALLLERGERWARDRGCGAVRVRTNVLRERAHRFYEREGYVRLKQQAIFEKRL